MDSDYDGSRPQPKPPPIRPQCRAAENTEFPGEVVRAADDQQMKYMVGSTTFVRMVGSAMVAAVAVT